jgi:hypothetical protein
MAHKGDPAVFAPGRRHGGPLRSEARNGNVMVGAARFELATPCSRSRCATRLRYAPPDLGWAGPRGGLPMSRL